VQPVVGNAVSELTRNVRDVTAFITRLDPAQLTEAERDALGALLDDLAQLMAAAENPQSAA
jgi:hypothetical protein